MDSLVQKLRRNIKDGTLLQRAPVAIKNRIVKRMTTINALYFLDKARVMTKKYGDEIPNLGSNALAVGNYYLDKRVPLNKDSIVYSLGILTDISFDESVHKKFGCDIYMYDPTPLSIKYMESFKTQKHFKFFPLGIWTENKTLKFFEPKLGGSASIFASEQTNDNYFDAECQTMETVMRNNNHTHISVFKADIEGAALPILKQMLENEIFPDQIVVEFERPRKNMTEIYDFFSELTKLRSKLKDNNYLEFLLPRKQAKYYSLELLFVNKNKLQ